MKALALYISSIEIGDANAYLKKFVCCDRIQVNKGGAAGARVVFLVAALVVDLRTSLSPIFDLLWFYFLHNKKRRL